MAIYLSLSNIILLKSAIPNLEMLRSHYVNSPLGSYQEDDFLVAVKSLPFPLMELGMSPKHIAYWERYVGINWPVDWLGVQVDYGYHVDEYPKIKNKLDEVCELTLDELRSRFETLIDCVDYINNY